MKDTFEHVHKLLQDIQTASAENPLAITSEMLLSCHLDLMMYLSETSAHSMIDLLLITLVSGGLRYKLWAVKSLWQYGKMIEKHNRMDVAAALKDTNA